MKLAVALRRPRTPIGIAPARPSTSELSSGVPDITHDSARKATPRSRASAASSVARRARRHLHQQVGLGGAETVEGGGEGARAVELRDRSAPGGQVEGSGDVETVGRGHEPVARVGEPHDADGDPVQGRWRALTW